MDKIEERLVFKGRNKTICKITVFFLAWQIRQAYFISDLKIVLRVSMYSRNDIKLIDIHS